MFFSSDISIDTFLYTVISCFNVPFLLSFSAAPPPDLLSIFSNQHHPSRRVMRIIQFLGGLRWAVMIRTGSAGSVTLRMKSDGLFTSYQTPAGRWFLCLTFPSLAHHFVCFPVRNMWSLAHGGQQLLQGSAAGMPLSVHQGEGG